MIASGVISILFMSRGVGGLLFGAAATDTLPAIVGKYPAYAKFPSIVFLSTIIWLVVTFLTKPEREEVLQKFVQKIQPGGPGWTRISNTLPSTENAGEGWVVPRGILMMLTGCGLVYGGLFTTGMIIYGNGLKAIVYGLISVIFGAILLYLKPKI